MQTRSILIASGVFLTAAFCTALLPAHAGQAGEGRGERHGEGRDDGDNRWQKGLAIAPVQLNFQDRNKRLVGLGSYIVNGVAGCNDCHTHPNFAPGGDPYLGQPKMINTANYLAGGRVFGPFISRNITPEAPSGLPAGLTLAQFKEVLRVGTDFDNAHPQFGPLLQVMPWPVYQSLTDEDIEAIYAYLSAIPHAEQGPVGP